MKASSSTTLAWALSAVHMAVSLGPAACAAPSSVQVVDTSSGERVRLAQENAPQPNLAGTYWSPQTGALELVRTPLGFEGHYQYRICGCNVSGDLSGESKGNVLRVRITERSPCSDERTGEGTLYAAAPTPSASRPRLLGRRSYFVDVRERRGVPAVERRDAGVWTFTPLDKAAPSDESEHCP